MVIVDTVAVNTRMQVSLSDPDSGCFGYIPRSGVAGSCGKKKEDN